MTPIELLSSVFGPLRTVNLTNYAWINCIVMASEKTVTPKGYYYELHFFFNSDHIAIMFWYHLTNSTAKHSISWPVHGTYYNISGIDLKELHQVKELIDTVMLQKLEDRIKLYL